MNLQNSLIIANELKRRIIFSPKVKLQITGSIKRKNTINKDIDFLLITDKPIDYIYFKNKGPNDIIDNIDLKNEGKQRITFVIKVHNMTLNVDYFITTNENLPFAKYQYDSGQLYNVRSRVKAKAMGYKLNQYGLFKNGKRINGIHTEKDIFKVLGLHYRPPSKRS